MGLLTSAAVGAVLALGVVLVVAGLIPREPSTTRESSLWTKLGRWWKGLSALRQALVVGSLVGGVVVAALTGWIIAVVLVPLAVLGIPALLAEPPQREVELLAALDRWVRLLSPSIATGKSIRDAVISTRHQAPARLKEPVARLVARLDTGWSTREALLTMADEVESADADAILAALAIASSRGGLGARSTLGALADTTQDRLRVLREIAAERAKPRAVVRQVTIITLVMLGAALLLGGSFFAPYGSPVGQVIAAGLATAYVGSLVMLKRRTTPPPTPRFLRGAT